MNAESTYYFLAKSLLISQQSNFELLSGIIKTQDVDWQLFTSIASNHLVLQSLYPIYQKNNFLKYLPTELVDHLKFVYELNLDRNRKILSQTEHVSGLLDKGNISHVFLKGSAYLLHHLYEDDGIRIMEDIDILVNEQDFPLVLDILINEGYSTHSKVQEETLKARKHFPRLYHGKEPADIEIHKSALALKKYDKLPNSRIFQNLQESKKDKKIKIPDELLLFIHCVLHSQVEHKTYFTAHLRLREILDTYLLSRQVVPEDVLKNYSYYHKEIRSIIRLTETLLNVKIFESQHIDIISRCFIFRHKLNIRHKFVLRLTIFVIKIPKKIYIHYIKVPITAIYNKKVRQHFIHSLTSRKSWKNHIISYKKIFK